MMFTLTLKTVTLSMYRRMSTYRKMSLIMLIMPPIMIWILKTLSLCTKKVSVCIFKKVGDILTSCFYRGVIFC